MSYKSDIRRIETVIGQRNFSKIIGLTARSLRHYKTGKRKPSDEIQSSIKELKTQLKFKHRTDNYRKQKEKTDKINKEFIQIPKTKKYYKIKTKHYRFNNIEVKNLEVYRKRLMRYGCESGYLVMHVKTQSTTTGEIEAEDVVSTEITMIDDLSMAIIAQQIKEMRGKSETYSIKLIKRYDFVGVIEC